MIHSEHPYRDSPDDWDPARRFRGRLAAPVTIVTSGNDGRRAGLTVSSLFVVEGEPAVVHMVVGPTSDLWEVASDLRRVVIHVCRKGHEHLADVFAGLRPSPGGMFASMEVAESEWGPVLTGLGDRASCTVESMSEAGYSGVVVARVDRVEVTDIPDPLVHFRSRYRSLA